MWYVILPILLLKEKNSHLQTTTVLQRTVANGKRTQLLLNSILNMTSIV